MENNTAKHFVIQLGSLITLYLSIAFLLVLLFNIINLIYPDAVDSYWQIESYNGSVRLGIAMLIVFFPVYLLLTRKVNQIRRQENLGGSYLGFTKWLIYLSLLVGGGVIMGDLVAVILGFLNGELTARFMLKAGLILLVVGSAFYYYLLDAKGYWLNQEKKSITFGAAMAILVLVSLVAGFSYAKSPTVVREMKLDEKQVLDLQDMQWRIENHLRNNDALPASINELYVGATMPKADDSRKDYVYEINEDGFRLCAEFAHPTKFGLTEAYPIFYQEDRSLIKGVYNWEHEAGWYCFERLVDYDQVGTLMNPENVIIPSRVF